MIPAAVRCFAIGALMLIAGASAPAAPSDAERSVPPRRPSPLAVTRIENAEYVSVPDGAVRLGLKTAWIERGRKLLASDQGVRVELRSDSREIAIDGMRVFLGNPIVLRRGKFYVSKIDYERALLPVIRPALVASPPARPKVIALDPGHGGVDNGMENKTHGLKEKELTLDVAFRMKKLLEADGYTVVLTRSDDRHLGPKITDFQRRAEIANRADADLFVSIHFNSLYPDTKTSGTEVYTFTPQFQRSTRAWSPGEKDDTEREAAPVNRFDPWSSLFAHAMHREILGSLRTFDRGQKTMHSAVLRGLNCPAVLVESVFLSNDGEARLAATAAYRQRIAEAMVAGVRSYASKIDELRPKS